jgi:hypothetical protein
MRVISIIVQSLFSSPLFIVLFFYGLGATLQFLDGALTVVAVAVILLFAITFDFLEGLRIELAELLL